MVTTDSRLPKRDVSEVLACTIAPLTLRKPNGRQAAAFGTGRFADPEKALHGLPWWLDQEVRTGLAHAAGDDSRRVRRSFRRERKVARQPALEANCQR